jgi:hypothetical protein
MATATNKYPGKCCYCGQPVAPYQGVLARMSGKFVPAHKACDQDTHEYHPDPIDLAYEDQCARDCGF